MPPGKNPVTITDVARLAGVSPGTASKALNGRGGISAGTIKRVQQAAEQLGYQPNALARGLLTGRSFTVGLITTDSFGRFSIPVMQGAEDALGPGPHLGVPLRQQGRPDQGAALPAHAARTPGGRHHRDRQAPGPSGADRTATCRFPSSTR